jgi:hypothetical protein
MILVYAIDVNGKNGKEREKINTSTYVVKTASGYLPSADSLDTTGMNISTTNLQAVTSVDVDGRLEAIPQIRDHYAAFGDRLPNELAMALDPSVDSITKLFRVPRFTFGAVHAWSWTVTVSWIPVLVQSIFLPLFLSCRKTTQREYHT